MKIRLMENFRGVFYAPYYAAHSLGLYQAEGVDIELIASDTPGDAVSRLIDGAIDLTWGGPMRVMTAHDLDAASPLVSFCEVVSLDPFFLIGNCRGFRLKDLAHLRFACVVEVPTPWMCLQQDLREVGVNPEAVNRVATGTMADNYAALRQGKIDVMHAFEPYVTMAEREGCGAVLYAASSRGPTTYTAFIATRTAVARHRDAFAAITRAVANVERWLYANSADEFATAVASYFPDVPRDVLSRSLRRYRDAGLWARDPAMSRQGFDRLGYSFLSGGALTRVPSYEECVERSL